MLGKVRAIVSRLNPGSTGNATTNRPRGRPPASPDGVAMDGTTTAGTDSATPTTLYRCPSCEQVYLATDKQTCDTCDVAVDPLE